MILTLTRQMGVNLAGIEIILNMREKMAEMQRQMQTFTAFVQQELARGLPQRGRRLATRWCGSRCRRSSGPQVSRPPSTR